MKTLAQAIKEVFQEQARSAPSEHRLKTPECPSLTRYGHLEEWNDEERRHLSQRCAYCEKMIMFQWRIQPPSGALLLAYLLGRRPELKDSMELYLKEHEALRMAMPLYRRVGEVISQLGDAIFGAVSLPSRLPAMTGAFSGAQERLHLDFPSKDASAGNQELHWSFEEPKTGELEIRVDDPTGRSQRVLCYVVLANGEALEAKVTMLDAGEFGKVGTAKLKLPNEVRELLERADFVSAAIAVKAEP